MKWDSGKFLIMESLILMVGFQKNGPNKYIPQYVISTDFTLIIFEFSNNILILMKINLDIKWKVLCSSLLILLSLIYLIFEQIIFLYKNIGLIYILVCLIISVIQSVVAIFESKRNN